MEKHPIENMMSATLDRIRDMVDVNTVIGDPIRTEDGSTVIPFSRVSFGFVAGGGEFPAPPKGAAAGQPPFAGGTGAGVTVQPLGFLVCGADQVRLLPAQVYASVDRVIEMLPQAIADVKNAVCRCAEKKAEARAAAREAARSIPVESGDEGAQ